MKSHLKAGLEKEVDVYVPSSSLTIKEIQDQIPAKYFQRSAFHSGLYLLRDVIQVITTYAVMAKIVLPLLTSLEVASGGSPIVGAVKFAAWSLFWLIQGLNGTALWILAHECGHQAFSPSRQINDTVGFLLHSITLVPYHAWRISHGNHHKHTNHLTKDNVFVPRKENKVIDLVEETPIVMLLNMLAVFLFGWPAYLLFNIASQNYGRRTNHFEPSSPLFRPEDARDIVVSDVGIVFVLAAIGASIYQCGILSVFCWYIAPYLWVNFWLLYITYLQHSDLRIPHYSHDEWTFVRGAIAAVDRDYGFLLNSWLHHINDSHVVHHLFSQMPFYHAIVVTRKYIKGILKETYVEDKKPLWSALRDSWSQCRYVVPSEGVSLFYGFNKSR